MPLDNGDTSLLSKIAAGLGAALAAVGTWAWSHTHKRIDMKADKDAFDTLTRRVEEHSISRDMFSEHVKADDRALHGITSELSVQRAHIGSLFEKIEESAAETQIRFTQQDAVSHQRHVDLLNAIHNLKK